MALRIVQHKYRFEIGCCTGIQWDREITDELRAPVVPRAQVVSVLRSADWLQSNRIIIQPNTLLRLRIEAFSHFFGE